MNIPRFNTYQRIVLCLGTLSVALRCIIPYEASYKPNFTGTFFQCIGIIFLTGVLVYITGVLSETKRRLKITAIVLGIIILLFIGLIITEELTKPSELTRKKGETQVLSPEEWLLQRRIKELARRELLEELERRGELPEEYRQELQELRGKVLDVIDEVREKVRLKDKEEQDKR